MAITGESGVTSPAPGARMRSVDVIRGLACVLMAIDHVRVYSGVPAGGPEPGVFLTRWVTHFVAPVFALYAGTSAYLLGRRLGDRGALARFLFTRGAFLVVLEMTLIRYAWAFAYDPSQFALAGVIWMLGWCMILLGLLVRLDAGTVGWLGLAVVLFQQVFALVPNAVPEGMRTVFSYGWEFVYSSGGDQWSGIAILYVLVPWIGVMAAGYGLGRVLEWEDAARRRTLYRIGLGMTAVFLVVGSALAVGASGSSDGGSHTPFWMRLLNQQKYPASQLFLLMTLGPMIALMPLAERATGALGRALEVVGRVPLFYYLAHLMVIHTLAVFAMMAFYGGAFDPQWFATAPYTSIPWPFRWGLVQLYLVYGVALAILVPLSAWYAALKRDRPQAWMRYL